MASVVLVAYNGDAWLPRCLQTLRDAAGERLHLLLVDNSGNRSINSLPLDAYETDVVRTARPMGFAEANNFALSSARRLRKHIVFLNQDTISPPGWLAACMDVLRTRPDVGAVSPVIRTYSGDDWDPSFVACLPPNGQALLDESDKQEFIETENVPAAALVVRADVIRSTGPFDPIFGSYFEDYDLCRRIRREGFKVGFVPGARVQHFSGSATDNRERELRRMRQLIRNRFIYHARDTRKRKRLLARWIAGDLPRRLARGIIGTPSSQPVQVTLQAYLDILKLMPRLADEERDAHAWNRYLDELGWPPQGLASESQHGEPAARLAQVR